MNWVLLVVISWVLLGLEKGLSDALVLGSTGITPSFVFALVAFIAMSAPRPVVLWTAVALGVAMDLVFELPLHQAGGMVTFIGPHALAYALACQLILALRGLMIKRNPLTLGFLSLAGALVANTMLVTTFTVRAMIGAPLAWDAKHQMIAGLGSAVYTGVIATLLAFVLFPLSGPLGLPNQQQRRFGRR